MKDETNEKKSNFFFKQNIDTRTKIAVIAVYCH